MLAVSLLLLKLTLVDRMETPLRHVGEPAVTHPAVLQAGELRFQGYDLSQASVESGATFDIDMAWTAVAPPTANYQSNVWLVGPDGLIWSEKGTERPRIFEDAPPTTQWLPDQWAWDSREVQIFAGTPPGQYDIVLTLFDKATLQPLTLMDGDEGVVGPTAVIGQITVTTPARLVAVKPQFQLETAVANLTLLGYNQDRKEAAPGDTLLLTLFWQKAADPPGASAVFELQLVDEQGNKVQTWLISPVRADYPPADWLPGERLRGQHLLRLPAGLESGRHQFRLNDTPLGQISIQAPDRIFEQPGIENLVNVPFRDSEGTLLANLIGYTISNLQSPISLTLAWQAVAEIPAGYRVFVHLVDESGQIIAQSDGDPANWSRPTTGWMPGEYILDSHQLTPDSSSETLLNLRVGLYDPNTGERLRTETADFLTISLDSIQE